MALTDAQILEVPALVVLAVVVVLAATAVVAVLVDHATRLHRLHRRVETSAAALEQALARRRAAVLAWCARAPAVPEVAALAAAARPGRDESALTRSLALALTAVADADPPSVLVDLAGACEAVVMARRFANDAAARALRVRTKRLVRWAHLAGSAPMPATVEIDDEVPEVLAGPTLPVAPAGRAVPGGAR